MLLLLKQHCLIFVYILISLDHLPLIRSSFVGRNLEAATTTTNCLNGGTATEYSTCDCKSDFTGQFCETFYPGNCWDIYTDGQNKTNGVRTIYINNGTIVDSTLDVYCDKGWTVVQKRYDESLSFAKPWDDFLYSFGNFGSGDGNFNYWLGNSYLHTLTSNPKRSMAIKFIFKFCEHEGFVSSIYPKVEIGDASTNYVFMTYGNLIGSAGNGVQYFNGSQFSTVDNDHTGNSECPKNYDNGGFWFDGAKCKSTVVPNLSGIFPALNFTCFNEMDYHGILWTPLTGNNSSHKSLHYSEIQIAPTDAL